MATITAVELLARFESMAAATPAAKMAGAVAGAKIMREAVTLAAGKYATRPITRTAATNYPGGVGTFKGPAVQVKMTNRRAHLLDHDTRSHVISPGAVTGRRTQSPVLSNRATGFFSASPVRHPGTKGQLMWEKGLVAAEPKIVDAMNKAVGDQLLKVFR